MAVYTRVSGVELDAFLSEYDIGLCTELTEIRQGVENSNFILDTQTGRYILTIYEKRVDPADLPYFLGFSEHLKRRGLNTPSPVRNKRGEAFGELAGKKAAVIRFLEGVNCEIPTIEQCEGAGGLLAQMHNMQDGFPGRRENDLSPSGRLFMIFDKIHDDLRRRYPDLCKLVKDEIAYQKRHFPGDLPIGNIHADMFPDNVFFKDGKAFGVIDFYFSCTDFLAYDLAITIGAWSFERNIFDPDKYDALLRGYLRIRTLSQAEIDALPILNRGAALRFLLTRAHDLLYHDENALVKAKDPYEYAYILGHFREYSTASARDIAL